MYYTVCWQLQQRLSARSLNVTALVGGKDVQRGDINAVGQWRHELQLHTAVGHRLVGGADQLTAVCPASHPEPGDILPHLERTKNTLLPSYL